MLSHDAIDATAMTDYNCRQGKRFGTNLQAAFKLSVVASSWSRRHHKRVNQPQYLRLSICPLNTSSIRHHKLKSHVFHLSRLPLSTNTQNLRVSHSLSIASTPPRSELSS
ncbi:Uncharacterized protein HZ326_2066 [Fusarium oxysporum f. sp. albedinis]|nr:Uncharacterized protein HZ326_2066 [Fusarium oxysporum f. sp. albedinis]